MLHCVRVPLFSVEKGDIIQQLIDTLVACGITVKHQTLDQMVVSLFPHPVASGNNSGQHPCASITKQYKLVPAKAGNYVTHWPHFRGFAASMVSE